MPREVVFKPQRISTPAIKVGGSSVGGTVYEEITLAGFAGLNNKYSNVEISDNEATDLLNVEFDARGAIQKRKGYTLARNFSTSQINSIMSYYPSNGTSTLVIAYGTNLIAYDPVANTSVTMTTTALHGNGLKTSGALDTPHAKLYMVNGDSTDGLMSWDGTNFLTKIAANNPPAWATSHTYSVGDNVSNGGNIYQCTVAGTSASSGTGPSGTGASITDGTVTWQYASPVGQTPNGKYLVYYRNHLYMAGDPSAPYRLYMSDQGDPTNWPTLNYIDFPDGKGGITGLRQLGDSIVVFKEQGVFILKGTDPSDYVVVDTFAGEHGAVSNDAIVSIPNGLVYLARDGIYLFDGKKFTLLSDKIQGSIDKWNQSYLQNAVAFEHDHKVYFSVPEGSTQTTNNYTYVFNYLYGWWTKHNIGATSFSEFIGSSEEPTPYFTDTNGNLFQLDSGNNDNENAIDAYLVTKAYDFGTSAHYKAFKGVQMTALATTGTYNLNISFILDFGVQSKTVQMPLGYSNPSLWGKMVWGKDPWGGYSEVTHMTTNVPGQCRYLQLKIEGNDKDAPFTFLGCVVRFKTKRRLQ